MRRAERGMTLMEVMIASAVMVIMMGLAWRTIMNTSTSRKTFEAYEERNHELRMAMGGMVADFEAAYLSRNEDMNASHPRTMMMVKSTGKVPDIHFARFGCDWVGKAGVFNES